MRYPDFFDRVPSITLYDPLAEFLGAAEGGRMEYRYADAVKLAGHSCPTVASAYLMTGKALQALYPDTLPERGAVRAQFRQAVTVGVTGVIANVVTLLTGATADTGFKGIAGRFDRRNLLFFNADIGGEIRFTRVESGAAVDVSADLSKIPAAAEMRSLMGLCLSGEATAQQAQEFGRLWQERVRSLLLDFRDDPQVIVVRHV
jgi:hypothetical protein